MFKEILLPIDLGDPGPSAKALATAVELGRGEGATLHLLAVLPGFGMSIVSQYFPENFEEKAFGTIYEEILRVAKEIGCDLIVMASHRPELKDYLLGPNAARVVRHAGCSVLVVRD
jgi:nucleotide-binding universal stress UspA family protein